MSDIMRNGEMSIVYRKIEKSDNAILSHLIKKVFEEFGIDIPGTVYTDPTTDALYELFQAPRSVFWIAEENDTILGGCDIYPPSFRICSSLNEKMGLPTTNMSICTTE